MPDFDPEQLDDDRLRRFFRHWDEKRGAHAMPAPSDMDPLDFPWALGWLSIVERVDRTYRWRLDGSRLAEFFRVEMQGRFLEDYPYPSAVPILRASFDRAFETRAPVFAKRRYEDERGPWRYRALFLPVGVDRATPDRMFHILALDPEDSA
jgi:hypothetical protein